MKRTLALSLLLAPAIALAQDAPNTLIFTGRSEMVKIYPDGKVKWLAPKKEVARAMVKLIGELQAQEGELAKRNDELGGRLATCEGALRDAVAQIPKPAPAPAAVAAKTEAVNAPASSPAIAAPAAPAKKGKEVE